MAVNKSDWSYGWHGHRAGLALYYFDETILLNEHHELRSLFKCKDNCSLRVIVYEARVLNEVSA